MIRPFNTLVCSAVSWWMACPGTMDRTAFINLERPAADNLPMGSAVPVVMPIPSGVMTRKAMTNPILALLLNPMSTTNCFSSRSKSRTSTPTSGSSSLDGEERKTGLAKGMKENEFVGFGLGRRSLQKPLDGVGILLPQVVEAIIHQDRDFILGVEHKTVLLEDSQIMATLVNDVLGQ